jgi:hypothetical protein
MASDLKSELPSINTLKRRCSLAMEYNPAPPSDCGSPERADQAIIDHMRELFGPLAEQTAKALHARLPSPDRALINAIAAGAPAWQRAQSPGA